ncbi:cell wall-binding repeat-containing protein [Kineococcus sp. SYSU DK002]|uniref:cell wall-binding repeat-containing protein n=1 Tax=Kineococcus sp. SYSU DK002 TaxID=3383123 RepID=UPI003D7D9A87
MPLRRAFRALLAVPLLSVALAAPAAAGPGFAPDEPMFRLGGADRFETAAITARDAFPDGSDVAVVANGWRTVDALTGTYLAGLEDAPVLLTDRDTVPAATLAAARDLGVRELLVLGDEVSVGPGALRQFADAGLTVRDRVAGRDRYDTSARIAEFGEDAPSTVFLARGDVPAGQVAADALAAGPYSFDGHRPVLLTPAGQLPAEVAQLLADAQPYTVYVLGGAISEDVVAQVRAVLPGQRRIIRVAGADRTATATLLARQHDGRGSFVRNATAVALANGYSVDALVGGVWAGRLGAPLLLTDGTGGLGTGTEEHLAAVADLLRNGVVLGSERSVPQALAVRARGLGGARPGLVAAVTGVDVATGAVSYQGVAQWQQPRDRFAIDGRRVSRAEFVAAARVGDRVVKRGRSADLSVADDELLTTRPQDWTTAFAHLTGPGEFAFVEPRTGLVLRRVGPADVAPTATFTVDGRPADRAGFSADLSTGDTVVAASDGSRFSLDNRIVQGTVVRFDATGFWLDVLDTGGSAPLWFPLPVAGDEVFVSSQESTAAAFTAALRVGQWVADERVGGVHRVYG